jgi:hypothetical protein
MINENTWHKDPAQQTCFVWCIAQEGIEIHHSTENPSYIIYWQSFHAVLTYAQKLARQSGNIITAGTHITAPTPGSVGEWVLNQNLRTSIGQLTPKHLSFLGPIFGRMGFVTRQLSGNSIQWLFI